MRFHLIKDVHIILSESQMVAPKKNILFTPKTAVLKDSISPFTPMLSQKGYNPNEFWTAEVMETCRDILMKELDKSPKTLDPTIIIQLTSTLGNGKFTVQIRDFAMLVNIYQVCGASAKLMVEINFFGVHGATTMAGLITREMSICQDAPDRNKICCEDKGIFGTEAMQEFWEYHTCSYDYNVDRFTAKKAIKTKPMNAVCNVILIVDDNWPLFKTVVRLDTNRQLLDIGLELDVVIVTDDGSLKCRGLNSKKHSEMFQKFFEKAQPPKSTERLFIGGISKASVKALLKFLSCEELPADDFGEMFELLKASQKFEIIHLEHAIIEALFQKPDSYFTMDAAEKVIIYAINQPRAEMLKKKMARIIAR